MNTKTIKALRHTSYTATSNPAIVALVAFAAQNSGIDARNYFSSWTDREGIKAFRSEQRAITRDWKRFLDALHEASALQVTDADLIRECKSTRLEWHNKETHCISCRKCVNSKGHNTTCPICLTQTMLNHTDAQWHYVTGQYFSTEYRKAAASLLEACCRAKRQANPVAAPVTSIAELKEPNRRNGGCWFDPDAMRFFGTRIETGIMKGAYFVTSEQPPHGPRGYTVRSFDEQGSIGTVGDLCGYRSKGDAVTAIREDM